MRANHLVLVAAGLISGCKKSPEPPPSAAAPTSTADQDALWALAPDKPLIGLVISPAGLARIDGGAADIHALFDKAPELAPFQAKIEQEIEDVLGTKRLSLAAAGLTAKKGLAVFLAEGVEKPIVILPVGDRDKFLAVVKGEKGADHDTIKRATCKTVKNVYACAREPALFDRLGKGSLADTLKLAGARGDIELAGAAPGTPFTFAGVAQLGRGSAVVRAAVKGVPADVTKLLANAKPRVDGDQTAGFAMVQFAPFVAAFADQVPPLPVLPDVTADALVKSLAGPLSLTIDNGAAMFDVRLPLNDAAPVQTLVEQCDKLPPAQQLGATVKDGVCHAAIPQMQLELDAWVDGKTLRVGKKTAQRTGATAPLSPVAKELASGEWVLAMHGRGTMFGQSQLQLPIPPGPLPPDALLGLRAFSLLSELGVGVRVDGDVVRAVATLRTVWSNPDDVVAKLLAIKLEDVAQGKAGAQGKTIADASPGSPFASDYRNGITGLMLPASIIGVIAAVAVPAYFDYMKKAKRSEASLQLNILAKHLKVAYLTNGAFPKGTVGPTPAKSCCEYPGHKCEPDATTWADPVWQALDFRIDEPHLQRYSYTSDGQTFVAKAIADLDCDGEMAEHVMTGRIENGAPVVDVLPPPPGEY